MNLIISNVAITIGYARGVPLKGFDLSSAERGSGGSAQEDKKLINAYNAYGKEHPESHEKYFAKKNTNIRGKTQISNRCYQK